MGAAPDDWRRTSQERYLPPGTEFVWQRYRAESADHEHAHCAFCWAKFMDPDFSDEHRRFIAAHPDVLTEGYTTTPATRHWVPDVHGRLRQRIRLERGSSLIQSRCCVSR
jgi:hypothetical protein